MWTTCGETALLLSNSDHWSRIIWIHVYTRLEEVNSDSGELLPIHRSVTDWKNMLTTFFFFPVSSWLINDGFFPSETPVTGVNVSFSCMNFLVSRNCQIASNMQTDQINHHLINWYGHIATVYHFHNLSGTTARVVETSVTVNNSPIRDYFHPNDQTQPTDVVTPILGSNFHKV